MFRADPQVDPHWLAVGGFAAYCQLVPFEYGKRTGEDERVPDRKIRPVLLFEASLPSHIWLLITAPMVSAASCFICAVAWVQVFSVKHAES